MAIRKTDTTKELLLLVEKLCKAGELDQAEKVLEQELERKPDDYLLLMNLGRLDEIRGQYLNAYDLYQRAEFLADKAGQKEKARRMKAGAKKHIVGKNAFGSDYYKVRLEGNSKPLELEYSLKHLARRKELLDAILATMDPGTKTILEIECDAGIITKNLADHGFKVEGTAENMDNIVLAMGFEYGEMLRQSGVPSPNYYCSSIDEDKVKLINKKDVIMVLPPSPEWYTNRTVAQSALILAGLLKRVRRQLYFYFPPENDNAQDGGLAEAVLSNLKEQMGNIEFETCFRGKDNSTLYRIDRRQANTGDRTRVVPLGLDVNGSNSSIFEVELQYCRSLNGFGYTEEGWDHFVETLREVIKNHETSYEQSILKRFYGCFQPKNRQDHFFGSDSPGMPPLDRGWTILPWMETKNRQLIPVKSPVSRPGGNHHYGPNSDEFGRREFNKLVKTYNLIRRFGYLPEIFPDGYVQGYFLKDGDNYRFCINEGQHRMAAISLTGHKVIKCKLDPSFLPVINLEHLQQWPQVKSGLYTREVAERVFRYYFEEDGRRKAKEVGLLK